jgi:hypothetical protein
MIMIAGITSGCVTTGLLNSINFPRHPQCRGKLIISQSKKSSTFKTNFMLPAITLWPSASNEALVNAITEATRDNKRIVLMPGPHLTKPGYLQKISIGKNGLNIKGSLSPGEYSSIKRPDKAIDLLRSDSNYGLFFIPAKPTEKEWLSVKKWKTQSTVNPKTGVVTTFQYAVIIRGAIKIESLELDCNMGKQELPATMPSEKIEHSAMLGFSGQKYKNDSFPGKFIFVGFESVTINNIRTVRGGYADDIWISRGYFRPNIGKVSINNISSRNRINNKRATISFSGLSQNIEIKNANIFKLEAEETSSRWNELPGEPITPASQYSNWKLKNIKCEMLDLAAKGQAIFINADNIESTKSTNLYQLGGLIKNSTFNMLPQPTPLNRLNALTFKNVTWIFSAYRNAKGNFIGIAPTPQYGERCSATFIQNTFSVNGELVTDAATEQHCLVATEYSAVAGNEVTLEFSNCNYDKRFGNENKTHIAKVFSRGQWKIKKSDFIRIPMERALLINQTATINNIGNNIVITIP